MMIERRQPMILELLINSVFSSMIVELMNDIFIKGTAPSHKNS